MTEPGRDPYALPPDGAPPPPLRPPAPGPRPPGPIDPGGRRAIWWTLAAAVLLIPLAPVALVLCIVAVITAARALRRAGRSGGRAPGALGSVIIASIMGVFAFGLTGFIAFFLPELRDYQECSSGANTHIAKQECEQQFRDAVSRKVGVDV